MQAQTRAAEAALESLKAAIVQVYRSAAIARVRDPGQSAGDRHPGKRVIHTLSSSNSCTSWDSYPFLHREIRTTTLVSSLALVMIIK